MKIAFFDRDGTIVHDYPDSEWKNVREPQFLKGAISGLKSLRSMGFQFIIITNQYLIHEGYISELDYREFTDKMLNRLKKEGIDILDIYYCPHRLDENCDCCKPKLGMIDKALADHKNIVLEEAILIGDSICDRELAMRLQIPFYRLAGGSLDQSHKVYQNIYCAAKAHAEKDK